MSSQNQLDHVFTAAERIQQLNDIDRDVSKLLESAGAAIGVLTNINSSSDADTALGNTLESRKAAFTSVTSEFFALLSSLDVRLRRQVYALEEASIIQSNSDPKTEGASAASAASARNPLDIGWLNSRKGLLERKKEAELWAEARQFVEANSGNAAFAEQQESK
ncbi:F-actin-capping protein subunit beta [Ascosphaera pollenicola]|nr:F-actin-capping protein subunit beta [Ascosphaera pollenicola]